MKTLSMIALLAGLLPLAVSAQTGATAPGCAGCSSSGVSAGKPAEAVAARPIPGRNENMLVGRIENLIPIGVVTVLGCEKCAEEVVAWALQQGSPVEDVDRALRTVAAMQKLDCFNQQFGPEVAGRMDKPLAAARRALQQARERAAK